MKFQIGQKVRVVWACTMEGARLVGMEGTITEAFRDDFGDECYGLDILGTEEADAGIFGWGADQLAPAMPDRNQIVEWSECLWQPPSIREREEA